VLLQVFSQNRPSEIWRPVEIVLDRRHMQVPRLRRSTRTQAHSRNSNKSSAAHLVDRFLWLLCRAKWHRRGWVPKSFQSTSIDWYNVLKEDLKKLDLLKGDPSRGPIVAAVNPVNNLPTSTASGVLPFVSHGLNSSR